MADVLTLQMSCGPAPELNVSVGGHHGDIGRCVK